MGCMIFFKGNWRDYKAAGNGMSNVRNYIALFCRHYQLFISRTPSLKLSKPLPAFKTLTNVKESIVTFIIKEQVITKPCEKFVYCLKHCVGSSSMMCCVVACMTEK